MKNATIIMLSMGLILNGCGYASESQETDQNCEISSENTVTKSLIEISVDEIYKKQSDSEVFFLYIGRNTCPYCLEFIPKLNKVITSIDVEIYFLDSVDTYDNSSNELKEFRDLYAVETVPAFILFHGKKDMKSLEINSTTTEENILEFIESEL